MTDAQFNTQVADLVVPQVFTPYVQQLTEQKSRLIQSGALERSPLLDKMLAGGGLTFNMPSFRDLDNDTENIATDAPADHFGQVLNGTSIDLAGALTALSDSRPKAINSATEIAVRMSRNQSWGSSDLAADLAGADPLAAIGNRVAGYWERRLQAAFIATMQGVSKDNGVNDSGDLALSIAGSSFIDGVTNFSAEAVIDAAITTGDTLDSLGAMLVHSVVYARMQKNNLIDFIPDSEGKVNIPTFLGRRVVVDDGMPTGTSVVLPTGAAGAAGMYETWFFGPGAVKFGVGSPKVPTETQREPQAGNGGGQEILYSRVEWSIHPVGHAYVGTAPSGGPSNAASTNNLNIATSWDRRYSERKQIKFARLITREA